MTSDGGKITTVGMKVTLPWLDEILPGMEVRLRLIEDFKFITHQATEDITEV